MNELRERKNRIRDEYRALRRSMDPSLKAEYDAEICRRFMTLASYRYADILLLYAPLPDEIDIYPIFEDALKRGKQIAFPRCLDREHDMVYHFVSHSSQLKKGSYGIMEPDESLPLLSQKEEQKNMLCFIPGLCFDRRGYRLGYGKGYYDRYLTDFKGACMGLCYSDFILDSLPQGKYDRSVDFIVTEKGVLTINAN